MPSFPTHRPFHLSETSLSRKDLCQLHARGDLRRLLRGVYADPNLPDTLSLRAQALALVVPARMVVTDRTAAWLHGVDLLRPDEVDVVPPVSVFHSGRGRRSLRGEVRSGQRFMGDVDVMSIDGVRVTTPLRTALDLGRLEHRDRSFAALDAFLRFGVDRERLLRQVERFKGYRGVCQLRTLAPLADPRSQSPAESITRLRWYDAATPYPDLQVPVNGPGGLTWYLDLGVRELYFAVEYDGEQWHDSPAQRRRDERRRRWIATNTPWTLKVVRRHHVFGKQQSLDVLLPQWIADAKRTLGQRLIRHARRQSG